MASIPPYKDLKYLWDLDVQNRQPADCSLRMRSTYVAKTTTVVWFKGVSQILGSIFTLNTWIFNKRA